jgi:hypothetical protein
MHRFRKPVLYPLSYEGWAVTKSPTVRPILESPGCVFSRETMAADYTNKFEFGLEFIHDALE